MKKLFYLFTLLIPVLSFAQQNQGQEFLPDAIYEVRYWQNLSGMGTSGVLLDTMIYQGGHDRAGFDYQNAECVSFHCKETDDMVYNLLPKFGSGETEWNIREKFVRKIQRTSVPFRGVDRGLFMIFVTDKGNELSGYGDYSMVSKEFGVVSRWNGDGEFYQLLRIDVYKNGRLLQEIDLLPLHDQMFQRGAYRLQAGK